MLKTEQNTEEIYLRIDSLAKRTQDDGPHKLLTVHYEHGQHWLTCADCGAQRSVCDAEGPGTDDGFCLEQVSDGDGYCEEVLGPIRRGE